MADTLLASAAENTEFLMMDVTSEIQFQNHLVNEINKILIHSESQK